MHTHDEDAQELCTRHKFGLLCDRVNQLLGENVAFAVNIGCCLETGDVDISCSTSLGLCDVLPCHLREQGVVPLHCVCDGAFEAHTLSAGVALAHYVCCVLSIIVFMESAV